MVYFQSYALVVHNTRFVQVTRQVADTMPPLCATPQEHEKRNTPMNVVSVTADTVGAWWCGGISGRDEHTRR